MQGFNIVKSKNAQVQPDVANWGNKADDYVNEFSNNEIERIYGTQFGENLAIISALAENATAEPGTFRDVRDLAGRLQAAAIVHQRSNYLEIGFRATTPWNIWLNQSQSIKGTGTARHGRVSQGKYRLRQWKPLEAPSPVLSNSMRRSP